MICAQTHASATCRDSLRFSNARMMLFLSLSSLSLKCSGLSIFTATGMLLSRRALYAAPKPPDQQTSPSKCRTR